ncbi:cytochrome-c peroxidase [Mangrovicoccus sp. HB161399]|uniref:cytochrome-c peroxidase n=1 Tax=Mangrovicoccus sp. HB161399 TaxID=2720392 RepID=UPI001556B12B|nr:cytochrome c peroxidase [Mangrovicoccus sp. HB161399]
MRRVTALALAAAMTHALPAAAAQDAPYPSLEALGEALFFDTALSANRTQSCATCHDPDTAFSDPRGAASPGDDGVSLGDRNAPSAAYAAFSPAFHRKENGRFAGGQFWDGRAGKLEDQAGGPPLNPIEMGMKDKAAVVARLRENPDYVAGFGSYFGEGALADTDSGYAAMTAALAAFERTPELAPFDSKYDRYLRGEAELTKEEELGRLLFFSQQFTNCNQCHQLRRSAVDSRETFTSYEYHNIGTPENAALRGMNGVAAGTVDDGLLANPEVDDPAERGKFKVPSLRNVAVTAPYMHNGVFEDLRTVVLFYNKYNTKNPERLVNPETGQPFGPAPVPGTLSMTELTAGPALDDQRIDAIVAFLKTLTDARYEPLLDN